MSFEETAQKRYEFLELINYLTQINRKVMLQVGSPEVRDFDFGYMQAWLNHLESEGWIKIIERPELPILKGPLGTTKNDWFVFVVKENFHEFVDKVYRHINLDIRTLSTINFLAVLDAAYDLRLKSEVTTSNVVLIADRAGRFPELESNPNSYRETALEFLKEYGVIKSFDHDGSSRYTVNLIRRLFDRTYQTILTRAIQEGHAIYKPNPRATKTIAEESKRRQAQAGNTEDKPLAQERIASDDVTQKVIFDPKASTLTYNKLSCDIPDESLEHYVCKLAFRNRRLAVKETDILKAFDSSEDSKRAVYDAMLRVNKKAKKLGLIKLLIFRAAKIRVNKIYQ